MITQGSNETHTDYLTRAILTARNAEVWLDYVKRRLSFALSKPAQP